MTVTMIDSSDSLYLEFTSVAEWTEQSSQVIEDYLHLSQVSAVNGVHAMTGRRQPPMRLAFRHPKLARDVATEAVATRDRGLKAALQRYADELKQTFAQRESVSADVARAILARMELADSCLSSGRR